MIASIMDRFRLEAGAITSNQTLAVFDAKKKENKKENKKEFNAAR
jgi:hypothetical protein